MVRLNVGFFMESERDAGIAGYLIASAKKHMPQAGLYQLTRDRVTQLPGAEVLRIPGDMPMGARRITHYASLKGNWLFLDTDVLLREDVSSVFEKPFDIALASRDGTIWEGTEYAKAMPYNFGVVFSRGPAFWQEALKHLKRLAPRLQEWEGEQMVTCEMARRGKFSVEILSSRYNFTPATKDEDVSDKAILHCKGDRKAWLSDLAS